MNFKRPLILGSNSPRRKQILSEAGYKFAILVSDTDESFDPALSPGAIVEYLAEKKADVILTQLEAKHVVVTADTIVYIDGEVLNKPADAKEAFSMLKKLSGKTHLVVTGICIADLSKKVIRHDRAEVTFKNLSDEEINYYIENSSPYDKAGAYGIQEWIGMIGISNFNGSFYTVMGLPIHLVYEELDKF